MNVFNPTENNLRVQLDGIVYEVEAGGTLPNVPEGHAKHWRDRIHNFIEISNGTESKAKVEVKEETEAETEEVEEKTSRTKKAK